MSVIVETNVPDWLKITANTIQHYGKILTFLEISNARLRRGVYIIDKPIHL